MTTVRHLSRFPGFDSAGRYSALPHVMTEMTLIRPDHDKLSSAKSNRLKLIQTLRGRKLLLSLQLLAVLFLPMSALLPVAAQASAPRSSVHGCFHDHRLCGCSPERIADHTCCCARSACGCSMSSGKDDTGYEVEDSNHFRHSKLHKGFRAAPCGSASSLFNSSVEDYVCLRTSPGGVVSHRYAISRFYERPESIRTHFADSIDPPPKFAFLF